LHRPDTSPHVWVQYLCDLESFLKIKFNDPNISIINDGMKGYWISQNDNFFSSDMTLQQVLNRVAPHRSLPTVPMDHFVKKKCLDLPYLEAISKIKKGMIASNEIEKRYEYIVQITTQLNTLITGFHHYNYELSNKRPRAGKHLRVTNIKLEVKIHIFQEVVKSITDYLPGKLDELHKLIQTFKDDFDCAQNVFKIIGGVDKKTELITSYWEAIGELYEKITEFRAKISETIKSIQFSHRETLVYMKSGLDKIIHSFTTYNPFFGSDIKTNEQEDGDALLGLPLQLESTMPVLNSLLRGGGDDEAYADADVPEYIQIYDIILQYSIIMDNWYQDYIVEDSYNNASIIIRDSIMFTINNTFTAYTEIINYINDQFDDL